MCESGTSSAAQPKIQRVATKQTVKSTAALCKYPAGVHTRAAQVAGETGKVTDQVGVLLSKRRDRKWALVIKHFISACAVHLFHAGQKSMLRYAMHSNSVVSRITLYRSCLHEVLRKQLSSTELQAFPYHQMPNASLVTTIFPCSGLVINHKSK
jgi:hypothetical protein